MKMTLSIHHAADMLCADENANWSRFGAFALVEYLEELEESTGEAIEFDRVAIRCDWAEYASLEDWAEGYFADREQMAREIGLDSLDHDGEIESSLREYIEARGTLIEFDGGIIVSAF